MTMEIIRGKKEARAALPAFISPPKAGMNIHSLEEAHTATFLAHSSLEWGWEDLLPQKRAIFPGALCRRIGGAAWHTAVPVGMLSTPVPEAVGELWCSPPIATSRLARAGGRRGSSGSACECVGSERRHGRGNREVRSSWMDQVSSTWRENRNPTEGQVPHMEGCFKRFVQWTEEDEEDI